MTPDPSNRPAFRSVGAGLVLLAAAALQESEVVETRYPDGSPRERYEVVRADQERPLPA